MTEAELEPPWARCPEIPQGSIGWRMGGGEDYLYRWFAFVREHWIDQASAMAYLRRHPPAPYRWRRFLMRQLDDIDLRAHPERSPMPKLAHEAADVIRLASLKAQGLLAEDAAYPVFVRNQLVGGELAPAWNSFGASESPENGMRYRTRELGWWARWLGTACADRQAYLDRHPAPASWASSIAQIRAGTSTAWQTLEGGSASLIPAMVLHGLLPPPWTGGHPPLRRDVSWETDDQPAPAAAYLPIVLDKPGTDDRDRWIWWVLTTFDDQGSWRAYLERWPPPEAWREPLGMAPFRDLSRE
jgi:hypothetical protein